MYADALAARAVYLNNRGRITIFLDYQQPTTTNKEPARVASALCVCAVCALCVWLCVLCVLCVRCVWLCVWLCVAVCCVLCVVVVALVQLLGEAYLNGHKGHEKAPHGAGLLFIYSK